MSGWLAILLLSMLASAYFAGSETAIVTAGRLRHRADRERGNRLARLAERLYRRPEHTISTLLVGNNMGNVMGSIAGLILTERAAHALGLELAPVWSDLLSSLWVALTFLVLGEVLPKSVAHHYALRISRFTAPALTLLVLLLWPLFWLFDAIARLFRPLLRRAGRGGGAAISWETVRLHVEAGRAAGVLGEEQEVVIQRIGLLGSLSAGSLMQPRERLTLFSIDARVGDVVGEFARGRQRHAFLVDEGGRVQGLLPARRLLALPPNTELRDLMSPLARVSAHTPVIDLIDELQPRGRKIAAVTDDGGGVLGVVFLEDVMRQLLEFRIADPGPRSAEPS